jgi:type IV secretion system protein VirB3
VSGDGALERNAGVVADLLFVGVTRPPMRFGVTYMALLLNLVVTMEAFLLTRNILMLLVAGPLHAVSALLCARDARIFELLMLWARTRGLAYVANARLWKASSYSALMLDMPRGDGRRRHVPWAVVGNVVVGKC